MKPVTLPFQVRSAEEIRTTFDALWKSLRKASVGLHFSNQTESDFRLAFYEGVANAIRHANEIVRHGAVSGDLFLTHRSIGFRIVDHGKGFDPEKIPVPDLADFSASGRGIFMMKQVADSLRYRKATTGNVLTFKRHLVGQNASMREIDVFYDISEAVVRGLPVNEVFKLILEQAVRVFPVDRASILLYDEKVKRLKVAASYGISGDLQSKIQIRAGEGVSGFVFQHGRPLLIENINNDKRGLAKRDGYKSHSFMSVPLIRSPLHESEKIVGVINLTDRTDGQNFSRRDLKILSTLANQAMLCLHIRDLMADSAKTQEMQREFDIIRRIQMSYLPHQPPTVSGYDVAGRCDMATTLGGDYYDFLNVKDWLYVVIADVSGHDARSAMTMLGFRSQFRVLAAEGLSPDVILSRMNAVLYEDLAIQSQFVSALVLRIQKKTGRFESASAGHYPPLFQSGKTFSSDSGLLVGIERSTDFPLVKGVLKKDDALVFFTDGVLEAMNSKQEMYGLKRVSDVISKNRNEASERLVEKLIQASSAYRSGSSPQDDMAVVCLKRLG